MRRGINQPMLGKICAREPVRAVKLAKCLNALEQHENGCELNKTGGDIAESPLRAFLHQPLFSAGRSRQWCAAHAKS